MDVDEASLPESDDLLQARWRALVGAVGRLGGDLEVAEVLQRVVDAARDLAGARRAALGVLGEDGRLAGFLTSGMDEEQRSRIQAPPCGLGVLEEMASRTGSLRLADLREHPSFVGFPPGHPVMRSFLGTAIPDGDGVFGHLYLTDEGAPDGDGPAGFTQGDERLVLALSAAAGVAVAGARRYEQTRRRQRWLEATAAASRALVPAGRAAGVGKVLTMARTASRACGAALVLPAGAGDALTVEAADGCLRPVAGDELPPALVADHLRVGTPPVAVASPALVAHLGAATGSALVCRVDPRQGRPPEGPGNGKDDVGLLVLAWDGDEAPAVLAQDAPDVLAFADRVALSLEVARAQAYRARAAVFEDRDRIARDLHDLVIQRLFAVGMSLQAVERQPLPSLVARRLTTAVDDLDATIDEVRRTIFSLHERPGVGDMRADVEHEVRQAAGQLGFAPAHHLAGALEDLPWGLRADVLAVLREALSNVARHAGASAVDVSVAAGDVVEVAVRDDGRGMDATGRRSGLANLERRALELGGSLVVDTAPGQGTLVRWRAPVR